MTADFSLQKNVLLKGCFARLRCSSTALMLYGSVMRVSDGVSGTHSMRHHLSRRGNRAAGGDLGN